MSLLWQVNSQTHPEARLLGKKGTSEGVSHSITGQVGLIRDAPVGQLANLMVLIPDDLGALQFHVKDDFYARRRAQAIDFIFFKSYEFQSPECTPPAEDLETNQIPVVIGAVSTARESRKLRNECKQATVETSRGRRRCIFLG